MQGGIRPFLVVRVVAIAWIIVVAIMSFLGSDFGGRGMHSVGDFTGKYRVIGTVEVQDLRDGKSQWTLRDLSVDGALLDNRLLIFAPSSDVVTSGDVVSVFCDIKSPQPINGFPYDRYLASKDIYATCFSNDVPLLLARHQKTIVDDLRVWRETIVRRIGTLYAPDQAALLSGLLIGTQTFTDDWSATFRAAGISHIVAASGSNVEMVVTLLGAICIAVGLSRHRSGIVLCLGIIAYIILAGAAAPVVRAGILAILLLVARHLGRPSVAAHFLLVTIATMLVFQPLLLLYDIGFQLSILSTWALIVFAPWVQKRLLVLPLGKEVNELLASTTAITLVTAPLLLWTFGSISLVAIMANLFLLPLVTPAMIFGALSLFFSPISWLASWILSGILLLARFFAQLPYASLIFSYVDSFSPRMENRFSFAPVFVAV